MVALRGNSALDAATLATLRHHTSRSFSSYRALRAYDDTVQNLRIGKHTRVIYQVLEVQIIRLFSITSSLTSPINRDSLGGLLLGMLRTVWNMVPTSWAESHRVKKVNLDERLTQIRLQLLTPPSGEHLGLPLLPDLRKAKEQLKPDATAVFVAAPHCGKAIEDAIEAEIPLIVAVAEHIPLHDILRVSLQMAQEKIKRFLISRR
jgi:succinyl-CoA synthetase alpha subunit